MAKRFLDTDLWKKQRWFRKLSPEYKLAYCYIKDQCDHAGIWNIDCADLIDDLGIESFDIKDFTKHCNIEFDKMDGTQKSKERIRILKKGYLWITGFIQFQYEGKEKKVSAGVPAVKTAIQILQGLDLYEEAINKGFITLTEGLQEGSERIKDKDKDKDIEIFEEGVQGEETLQVNQQLLVPEMFSVFKTNLKQYPGYIEKDFKPLFSIAKFLHGQMGLNGNPIINKDAIVMEWDGLCGVIAKDNFYKQKSLLVISNHIQEVYQIYKNGKPDKGTSTNFKSSPRSKFQPSGTGGY